MNRYYYKWKYNVLLLSYAISFKIFFNNLKKTFTIFQCNYTYTYKIYIINLYINLILTYLLIMSTNYGPNYIILFLLKIKKIVKKNFILFNKLYNRIMRFFWEMHNSGNQKLQNIIIFFFKWMIYFEFIPYNIIIKIK